MFEGEFFKYPYRLRLTRLYSVDASDINEIEYYLSLFNMKSNTLVLKIQLLYHYLQIEEIIQKNVFCTNGISHKIVSYKHFIFYFQYLTIPCGVDIILNSMHNQIFVILEYCTIHNLNDFKYKQFTFDRFSSR